MKMEVKLIADAPRVSLEHEDMGLCYVSKFTRGSEVFYSVTRQTDNPGNYAEIRVAQGKKDLLDRGYWWDGKL